MKKLRLLMRSNLHKAKGQCAAIFILVTIAALLLNIWIILSLEYKQNFNVYHDKLQEGDVTLLLAGDEDAYASFITAQRSSDQVRALDDSPVVPLNGDCAFGEDTCHTLFAGIRKSDALARKVGGYEILSDGDVSGVYLPFDFSDAGGYRIGDDFTLHINGVFPFSCKVAGFYASAMTSGVRCHMITLILSDDTAEKLPSFAPVRAHLLSIRLNDYTVAEEFLYDVQRNIHTDFPALSCLASNDRNTVMRVRYSGQMICAAVVSVAGIIFSVVALVMIGSNITDYIRQNLKKYGMLKAIGYSGKILRLALLLQFTLLSALAVMTGIGIGYGVFPSLNRLLEMSTGVPFACSFSWAAFGITAGGLLLAVASVSLLASRRLRTLPPLAAIRETTAAGKAPRNPLPIEKSHLPIHLTLACKTALAGFCKNLVIFLILTGVVFGLTFSVLIYNNIIADCDPAMELSQPIADLMLRVPDGEGDEWRTLLAESGQVENVMLYGQGTLARTERGQILHSYITSPTDPAQNRALLYDGRLPETDKEAAIGAVYARKNDIRIGETVRLEIGDNTQEYTVCGLIQIATSGGNDCLFTDTGYLRLSPLAERQFLITLTESADKDAFVASVRTACPRIIVEDYASFVNMQTGPFISMMSFVVDGVILICVLLILFSVYILVKSLLIKKRREYGILKSLGYTTAQLVLQTACSFMPVVLLSVLIATPLSCLSINSVFSLFLQPLGVVRTPFTVPVPFVCLLSGAVALIAFGLVCLLSLRIRKTSPLGLLSGR